MSDSYTRYIGVDDVDKDIGVGDVDEDIGDNKGRAECPPGRLFCLRLDSYCFLSLKMMMEMTMRWMSKMQSASSLCNVKKITFS